MKIQKALIGALAAAVGTVGLVAVTANAETVPHSPEANKASFWENRFNVAGIDCYKIDPVATPFVVPTAPDGREWYAVIAKAGAGSDANEVDLSVKAGDQVAHFSGKQNSHIILCHVPEDVTPTPEPSETPTSPAPTSPAPGEPTTPAPGEPTTPAPSKPGEPGKPGHPGKPGKPGKPGLPSSGN